MRRILSMAVVSVWVGAAGYAVADVAVLDDTVNKSIKDDLIKKTLQENLIEKTLQKNLIDDSLKGKHPDIANLASVTNENRNYLSKAKKVLPSSYLGSGYDGPSADSQSSTTIRKSLKVKFDTATDISKLIEQEAENFAQQKAIYQAMYEEAYLQATARYENIQKMIDEIKNYVDPKSVWDLQARIQGEQVMLQNEQIKLTALAQLQESNKDNYEQRRIELNNFKNKYKTADKSKYAQDESAATAIETAKMAVSAAVIAQNTALSALVGGKATVK